MLATHAAAVHIILTSSAPVVFCARAPVPAAQGFLNASHQNVLVSADPEQLVQQMLAWQPPASNVLADAKQRQAAIGEDIAQGAEGS